jgi:hypothetical protein
MHGFYPVGKNDPENLAGGNENLNTGIAVVVRVDRILDLINSPSQLEVRAAVKEKIERDEMPTPSTSSESPEFQEFQSLLAKLANAPKEEADAARDRETSAQVPST